MFPYWVGSCIVPLRFLVFSIQTLHQHSTWSFPSVEEGTPIKWNWTHTGILVVFNSHALCYKYYSLFRHHLADNMCAKVTLRPLDGVNEPIKLSDAKTTVGRGLLLRVSIYDLCWIKQWLISSYFIIRPIYTINFLFLVSRQKSFTEPCHVEPWKWLSQYYPGSY